MSERQTRWSARLERVGPVEEFGTGVAGALLARMVGMLRFGLCRRRTSVNYELEELHDDDGDRFGRARCARGHPG